MTCLIVALLALASLFGLGMYLGYRFDLEWDRG